MQRIACGLQGTSSLLMLTRTRVVCPSSPEMASVSRWEPTCASTALRGSSRRYTSAPAAHLHAQASWHRLTAELGLRAGFATPQHAHCVSADVWHQHTLRPAGIGRLPSLTSVRWPCHSAHSALAVAHHPHLSDRLQSTQDLQASRVHLSSRRVQVRRGAAGPRTGRCPSRLSLSGPLPPALPGLAAAHRHPTPAPLAQLKQRSKISVSLLQSVSCCPSQ